MNRNASQFNAEAQRRRGAEPSQSFCKGAGLRVKS